MKYALFIISIAFSLSAEASFKEICLQVNNSVHIDKNIKAQIEWIQETFQTKDCNNLYKTLKGIGSFTSFLPLNELPSELNTYDPVEYSLNALKYKFNYEKWLKTQSVFEDLKLFKEFSNLEHIDLGSFNPKEIDLRNIITKNPNIKSISINTSDLNHELTNLILEKKLKVHLNGNFAFNNSVEKLDNQIEGIQIYSGRILDLRRFKKIKSLGLKHIDPDSSLKELVIFQNLENLFLSAKYISKMNDAAHFRYLKFLKIECYENRFDNNNVTCQSETPEKIDFIKELKFLTGLKITVKDIEDIKPVLNLKSLRYLSLSGNNLSTIPDLEKLTNLEVVNLSYNNITDMRNIKSLKADFIDLGFNGIKKLEDYPEIADAEILLDGNEININDAMACPKNSLNKSIAKFCSGQK